jgi:hypothetical protein
MKKKYLIAASLVLALTTTAAHAANPDPAFVAIVIKVVKYCVGVVNSPDNRYFDAFYNAATGRVENNALTVGDQYDVFRFDKCMAEQRIPLGG